MYRLGKWKKLVWRLFMVHGTVDVSVNNFGIHSLWSRICCCRVWTWNNCRFKWPVCRTNCIDGPIPKIKPNSVGYVIPSFRTGPLPLQPSRIQTAHFRSFVIRGRDRTSRVGTGRFPGVCFDVVNRTDIFWDTSMFCYVRYGDKNNTSRRTLLFDGNTKRN